MPPGRHPHYRKRPSESVTDNISKVTNNPSLIGTFSAENDLFSDLAKHEHCDSNIFSSQSARLGGRLHGSRAVIYFPGSLRGVI